MVKRVPGPATVELRKDMPANGLPHLKLQELSESAWIWSRPDTQEPFLNIIRLSSSVSAALFMAQCSAPDGCALSLGACRAFAELCRVLQSSCGVMLEPSLKEPPDLSCDCFTVFELCRASLPESEGCGNLRSLTGLGTRSDRMEEGFQ